MNEAASRQRLRPGPAATATTSGTGPGTAPGGRAIPLAANRKEHLVEAARDDRATRSATPALGPDAPVPENATPETLIEPTRALALADFDAPQVTPGERLIRLAYRLGKELQATFLDVYRLWLRRPPDMLFIDHSPPRFPVSVAKPLKCSSEGPIRRYHVAASRLAGSKSRQPVR